MCMKGKMGEGQKSGSGLNREAGEKEGGMLLLTLIFPFYLAFSTISYLDIVRHRKNLKF